MDNKESSLAWKLSSDSLMEKTTVNSCSCTNNYRYEKYNLS